MNYSITSIAHITGLSPRAIRFYEEAGLLQPERNANNGYRIYTEYELLTLYRIISLRSEGNSIESIKTIMTNSQTNAETIAAAADAHNEQYREEAYNTYDPKIVQQSQERFANWSTEQKAAIMQEGKILVQQFAEHLTAGLPVESNEAQKTTAAYHLHMNHFYDCTKEIFAGLGEMYVEDARFAKHYEEVAEGLAQYVRDAILVYTQA